MRSWLLVICVAVVILLGGGYYLFQTGITVGSTDASPASTIMVTPQAARDRVVIDRAYLAESGFVVVRGSDGKRLGQIIEISKYLEPGEYGGIEILLGDFYTYNEADQLIAMIYKDDGDQSFSGLDQPAVDAGGNMVARFVETGEMVPAAVTQEVATHSGTGMETVRYTNTGFQPQRFTVPLGTMIEFVNQSDLQMWVASNVHPSHEILPTFDQFKGVGKGETYMYFFDKKGSWTYHDHNSPAFEGIITVE